jgi:hypothetical protein
MLDFLKDKSFLVVAAALAALALGKLDADAFVTLVAGACLLANPLPQAAAAVKAVAAKVGL